MEELRTTLLEWDSKSIIPLRIFYNQHHWQYWLDDLLKAMQEETELRPGGSWLVKYHLEQGFRLEQEQIDQLIAILHQDKDWITHLHVLQSLSFFDLKLQHTQVLLPFIDWALGSQNKFVRAWSYNGLYVLAQQVPELESEVRGRLALALEEEAPSVKARIRNILKTWK